MSRSDRVEPLEHRAAVFVEEGDGYVDIQQEFGDHTKYTPDEARRIAEEILEAADAAEQDGSVSADGPDTGAGP
jgi:hypothetical protein